MNEKTRNGIRPVFGLALLGAAVLLLNASIVPADDHADARFRGTGKADPIRIENVRRSGGPADGQSSITFDVAWDHSWRAAWEVDEHQNGGKGTLKLESWDAAWVFAKFHEPGANDWSHATLSTDKADHRVPAGVALEVGLTDDGRRGVGVFVYRKTVGHGPNDFKGVTLRWMHAADFAGAVDLKVFAIQMVYVPSCPFWAGDGSTDRVAGQFSAGYSVNPFRVESERALTLGGETARMLNNRDAAGMYLSSPDDFNIDLPRTLPGEFPKGYQAFYCMRHEITQQQYVDSLNTLSYAAQAARTDEKPSSAAGQLVSPNPSKGGPMRNGIRIAVSGTPDSVVPVTYQRGSFVASGTLLKAGTPAAYETDAPHVACNFIRHHDGAAFAAWAGLRPMTELEFEKACRGPLKPVPNEYAWGTDRIAGMDAKEGKYVLQNAGQPDETVTWEGDDGPDATHGNAPSMGTNEKLGGPLRVGIFATPHSDRVSAGSSYWGILDLSGNLAEHAVSVGHPAGRTFVGNHGEGGESAWTDIFGQRGGGCPYGSHAGNWGRNEAFRTSNRYVAATPWVYGQARHFPMGFRCVRTAP